MFLIQPGPKPKYALISISKVFCLPIVLLDNHSKLAISIPKQAPIINIGRSYNSSFVINNQQFTMHIDHLSNWFVSQHCMCSQSEKEYIIIDVEILEIG